MLVLVVCPGGMAERGRGEPFWLKQKACVFLCGSSSVGAVPGRFLLAIAVVAPVPWRVTAFSLCVCSISQWVFARPSFLCPVVRSSGGVAGSRRSRRL